jgi:hypothetical protein
MIDGLESRQRYDPIKMVRTTQALPPRGTRPKSSKTHELGPSSASSTVLEAALESTIGIIMFRKNFLIHGHLGLSGLQLG